MRREKKRLLSLLLLSVCLQGGCQGGAQTSAPDDPITTIASPVVVHVFDVQPAPHLSEGDLLIPAALSVEDTAIVLAEREGRIVNLIGQEGARVGKGDLLAQLNDDDQRSQLRQAELDVARLKVEEQQFASLVKLNRSELDRELLLASQGLSSKSDSEFDFQI